MDLFNKSLKVKHDILTYYYLKSRNLQTLDSLNILNDYRAIDVLKNKHELVIRGELTTYKPFELVDANYGTPTNSNQKLKPLEPVISDAGKEAFLSEKYLNKYVNGKLEFFKYLGNLIPQIGLLLIAGYATYVSISEIGIYRKEMQELRTQVQILRQQIIKQNLEQNQKKNLDSTQKK